MQATITKRFQIAPEGHTVDTYEVGAVVSGVIAATAVANGHAAPIEAALETKPAAALETKPAKRTKRAAKKQGGDA